MKKLSIITIIFGLFSTTVFAGYMTNHPTKVDDKMMKRNRTVTQDTEYEYNKTPSRQAVVNESYNSSQISKVQMALKEKGYNVGAVDGVMGKKTRDSLMTFQANEALDINGELNQDTLNSLEIYSDPNEVYSE